MQTKPYTVLILLALLLFALGIALLRWWQGPLVSTYRIQERPLVQTIVASGRIVTPSRAQIGSEIAGVVLERRVAEGDQVQPGDTLLVLRDDELAAQVRQAEAALAQLVNSARPQAQVALQRAETQLAQASRETVRRRDLAARSLLSAEALEQAMQQETLARSAVESARLSAAALAVGGSEEALLHARLDTLQAQRAKTTIRSAIAGTILTRHVEPGDLVQPGRVLFTIAQGNRTEILLPLDEKNLPLLALEQNAQVIADAYPTQPFAASLTYIAPSIDPERGSIDVRLTVGSPPTFIRQDMTVSVNIETARREKTVVIPNDALGPVHNDKAEVTSVRHGKLQRQQVTLGLRGLTQSEIIAGLQVGDNVLTDANTSYPDGKRVRINEQPFPVTSNHPTHDSSTRNELPVKLN